VREDGKDRVVLRVTDRFLPGSYVAEDGTVLAEFTEAPPQTRDIVLVSTADGWRIAQIDPVTS
jgi:hypothetical protein